MPEGVHGYPRWTGTLSTGSAAPTVAGEELRRALNNLWIQIPLVLILAYAVAVVGQLSSFSRGGTGIHTLSQFVTFLDVVPWAGLLVAAIMGAPLLLEDQRQGALELYLSRAVTLPEYLGGKIAALLAVTTLACVGPVLLYYVATMLMFQNHPEGWEWVLPGALAWAFLWAVMVSGLALGLAAVSRSSRGATLLLLGSFAVLDVFANNVFAGAQRLVDVLVPGGAARIVSPMNAWDAQLPWMIGATVDSGFEGWWGLVLWAVLLALGWGLLAWKRPRLGGAAE
ncbi:MAG TPA: ABC transporter permease subunit [Candidatus Thermoplasmatota archaeon]|nr:ABC transporter permease subunit [Candidatus Thermoplasmatota archaeon]